MGSLYLWGRSIQEMGVDVVIGHSIHGVVVIDGSLCSRFYGTQIMTCASQFSYSRHSKKLRIPRCQRIAPVLVIVVALSASLQCAHACKF